MTASSSMPVDFPEWAKVETDKQLRARYNIGGVKVLAYRAECGIPSPGRTYACAQVPNDFATTARGMTLRAASRHYGHSREIVTRWFEETGTPRAPGKPGPKAQQPAPPVAKSTVSRSNAPFRSSCRPGAGVERASRDMSQAGQAADYLRQFSGVWRCNADGGPSIGGRFWRRGGAVLTDAQIIERAEEVRVRRAEQISAFNNGKAA